MRCFDTKSDGTLMILRVDVAVVALDIKSEVLFVTADKSKRLRWRELNKLIRYYKSILL